MIDTQPSKLDELKDYLPADGDLERFEDLIELADSVQTPGSFLRVLDELCDHADKVAALCQRLRTRARKVVG